MTDKHQFILAINNSLITTEFATGYVTDTWDDRMHILINVTSCGTLVGQALSKTAFAVTLLKLTKGWYHYVLWFCIGSMNTYMIIKIIFQWAKICNKPSYDVWYRLDFCLDNTFRESFKEGGNSKQSDQFKRWNLTSHQSTTSSWTLFSQHSRGSSPGIWTCARSRRSVFA